MESRISHPYSLFEILHIGIEEAVLVHLREKLRPQGIVCGFERGEFIGHEDNFLYAKAYLRVWR